MGSMSSAHLLAQRSLKGRAAAAQPAEGGQRGARLSLAQAEHEATILHDTNCSQPPAAVPAAFSC